MSATLIVTLKEKGGVLDFTAVASAVDGTELESRVAIALHKVVTTTMRLSGRFLHELGGDDARDPLEFTRACAGERTPSATREDER